MKKTTSIFGMALFLLGSTLMAQVNISGNKALVVAMPAVQANNNQQNFNNDPGRRTHSVMTYVEKYDSIFWWGLDTASQSWYAQAFQKADSFKYDASNNEISGITLQWNGAAWVNVSYFVNAYSVSNQLITSTYFTWTGSSWENYSQYVLTYNSNGNRTLFLALLWNGSQWDSSYRYVYTYDSHYNDTAYRYDNYKGGKWEGDWKYAYTFNANNYASTETYQLWDTTHLVWNYSYLNVYTYDVNNNELTDTGKSWSGTAWVNNYLDVYGYNVNNKDTGLVAQSWNGSMWVNAVRDRYSYDVNNNKTAQLILDWNGTSWYNAFQYLYTYDVHNNLTSQRNQTYNLLNSSWVSTNLYTYGYDANNFQLFNTKRTYYSNGLRFNSGDSEYNYISVVTGVKKAENLLRNFTVYPNPSYGNFTIQWKTIPANSIMTIYNTLGEEVKSIELSGETNQLNLTAQPSGIYFYKAVDKNGTLLGEGKLIIQSR